MTLSRALAEYATSTAFEAIPGDVLATTKRFIVDTIGVALGGSTAPGTREVAELVLEEAGAADCTVWPTGSRTSASAAAFLNSMYASALDFDSVYEPGSIHADTVVLPAAWAVAERRRVRGRDFLAAVALGNDVACRLGRAAKKNPGWFATSIHGVFGAAAAAGRLLGLDARAVQNAFGIALSQAGGTQQAIFERSLTKRLQPAFAARAGLFSALLAERGITAPSEAFEGKFGFSKLYAELDRDMVVDGLGERYESLNTTAKKYPSCTANQPLVDGVLSLLAEHGLSADAIRAIDVGLSPFAFQLVGAPFAPGANPQVAAQFSAQYSIASALVRGRLGVGEIQDEAIRDPRIAPWISRISTHVDEGYAGKFAPCDLAIDTATHGRLVRRIDQVPGTPQSPLSDAELRAKFHDCARFAVKPLRDEQVDALIETLSSIERLGDIAAVFR